ncbi:MAG: TolC family protein [Bacteroidales bacterium]|nr:TolC family protein [Candidatus Liminaster caballi]
MRHLTLLFISLITLTASAQSPSSWQTDVASWLQEVESNNLSLKAMRHSNAASALDRKADNALGETSVEYSPFFSKGYDGVSSSELIVSQEIDFPTAYASRSRVNAARQTVDELQYMALRRDVMLQAECLLIDLQSAMLSAAVLTSRFHATDSLLNAYERRLALGDASVLEVNRIKLDRMSTRTEIIRNQSLIGNICNEMTALNGGVRPAVIASMPKAETLDHGSLTQLMDAGLDAPSADATLLSANIDVQLAEASLSATSRELSLTRQQLLPRLTLGYRRNTEMNEASNGFLLGVSMPLFASSRRTKASRLRQSAAELELQDTRISTEKTHDALSSQLILLRTAIDTYDVPLMQSMLTLLDKAVAAGQISVIEYFNETDLIYGKLAERIALVNEYRQISAKIKRIKD